MSQDYPEKIDLGATILIIDLNQIVDADKTQIREQENGKVIDDLVMQYQMEEQAQGVETDAYPKNFPPIVVVRTPDDNKKFWILDGHHRYAAAVTCRYQKIVASVIDNSVFNVQTLDDLHFLQGRENVAVTANRTAETKRRQVLAVLKKRPYWTMNQIAQFCRVSFYLVESVINEMESAGEKVETLKPTEKAAEAIANPKNKNKSNRQIAKETGVGEATVRRVRQNSNPKNDAHDQTPENESADPRAYNWKDPHCLLDGKALIQGGATNYNDYDGTVLSFCNDKCVKKWAKQNNRVWSKYSCNLVLTEMEEYMSKKNWTQQQKKDFVAGVRAYHEYKKKNSMPKTHDWADEKFDGYMYEEERIRQSKKDSKEAGADKDADALDAVSKKAQQYVDEHSPATDNSEVGIQNSELTQATSGNADGNGASPVDAPLISPKEVVAINDDGSERRCVGYVLPLFATLDEIADVVTAACSYKYNAVVALTAKLVERSKTLQK